MNFTSHNAELQNTIVANKLQSCCVTLTSPKSSLPLISHEDVDMRDASSPTNLKWQPQSGKAQYIDVNTSDEDNPDFWKSWLEGNNNMFIVSA